MFEQIIKLSAVHIRDEMYTDFRICPFIKRSGRHKRPKIRAANANINHISDGLT